MAAADSNIDPRILRYYGLMDQEPPADSDAQTQLQSIVDGTNQPAPGQMGSGDSSSGSVADYFKISPTLGPPLNQSLAQLGTLHGKVSDTSAPYNFVTLQNQQNKANQDAIDKKTGLRVSVLKFLADKNANANQLYNDRVQSYGENALDRQADMQKQNTQNDFNASQNALKLASAANKPTETQAKNANYGKDLETSNRDLNEIYADPNYDRSGLVQGAIANFSPNYFQSPKDQRLNNAEIGFANAISRAESGMNVTPAEFSRYQNLYFVRAGDSPEVQADKARRRQQKIENVKAAAGNFYNTIPTTPLSPTPAKNTPLEPDISNSNMDYINGQLPPSPIVQNPGEKIPNSPGVKPNQIMSNPLNSNFGGNLKSWKNPQDLLPKTGSEGQTVKVPQYNQDGTKMGTAEFKYSNGKWIFTRNFEYEPMDITAPAGGQ